MQKLFLLVLKSFAYALICIADIVARIARLIDRVGGRRAARR